MAIKKRVAYYRVAAVKQARSDLGLEGQESATASHAITDQVGWCVAANLDVVKPFEGLFVQEITNASHGW